MNDNAKKWVEALRSGAYKQGVGRLRDKADGYCCLGVACDLYIKSHPNELRWEGGVSPGVVEVGDATYSEEAVLHNAVREWLGLATHEGRCVSSNYGETSLAELNDSGSIFQEIANLIEDEPVGLFA